MSGGMFLADIAITCQLASRTSKEETILANPPRAFIRASAAKVRKAGCDRRMPAPTRVTAMGRPCRRPIALDFNGFRDSQCIFKLNAEITDCAVHLRVTKQ